MRLEFLDYFKDLLEGRADISWRAWFCKNDLELRNELPRASYLRLKFKQLDEAEALLREAGIEYRPDPVAANRERYYAMLHADVLDEKGKPLLEFQRQAYDGAYGLMVDGDWNEARRRLTDYVRKIRRRSKVKQGELFSDLCFDGEMEYTLGNSEIGRCLLEAVAAVPRGSDLTDYPTDRARMLLNTPSSID